MQQGQEANVYILQDGVVDIVMDIPPPNSTASLKREAALQPSGRLAGHRLAGPLQRVLIARRGPGAILGDEVLRSQASFVSAIVASPTATVLSTTQSRFTACMDQLTLRLFHKLSVQQQVLLQEVSQAAAGAVARQALLEHCRDAVLLQAYATAELPDTLKRNATCVAGMAGGQKQKRHPQLQAPAVPWKPPVRRPDFFGTYTSLDNGEHAARLCAETAMAVGAEALAHDSCSPTCVELDVVCADDTLPTGLRTAWVTRLGASESIVQLQRMVARIEQERAGKRKSGAGSGAALPPICDLDAARDNHTVMLDLRGQGLNPGTQQATDMYEAACVATIHITMLAGQEEQHLEELAPVLDDVLVAWSTLAHASRVQLVRWSSHRCLLLAHIDPATGGGAGAEGVRIRRPAVRRMADVLVGMQTAFDGLVAGNVVSHMVMHAVRV
jgi:hypothetical protein